MWCFVRCVSVPPGVGMNESEMAATQQYLRATYTLSAAKSSKSFLSELSNNLKPCSDPQPHNPSSPISPDHSRSHPFSKLCPRVCVCVCVCVCAVKKQQATQERKDKNQARADELARDRQARADAKVAAVAQAAIDRKEKQEGIAARIEVGPSLQSLVATPPRAPPIVASLPVSRMECTIIHFCMSRQSPVNRDSLPPIRL